MPIVPAIEAKGFKLVVSDEKYGGSPALAKQALYGFSHYHLFAAPSPIRVRRRAEQKRL
jgi:hypothetical protein